MRVDDANLVGYLTPAAIPKESRGSEKRNEASFHLENEQDDARTVQRNRDTLETKWRTKHGTRKLDAQGLTPSKFACPQENRVRATTLTKVTAQACYLKRWINKGINALHWLATTARIFGIHGTGSGGTLESRPTGYHKTPLRVHPKSEMRPANGSFSQTKTKNRDESCSGVPLHFSFLGCVH